MDVKKEMLEARAQLYERSKVAETVDAYKGILARAEAAGAPADDITICIASIAMVSHELNQLDDAIAFYGRALQQPLHATLRAEVLQNKAIAHLAAHHYDEAVRVCEQALSAAYNTSNLLLIAGLEANLGTMREAAQSRPDKIIVIGVGEKNDGRSLITRVEEN